MLRKNVASQFVCFQGVDATTGGIKSGVTWTMRRCLDGTFAAGGATITEDSTNGWYKAALTQADTNGNNVSYNFTGTGAIPQTINDTTTAADPTTATNFGITALPAVASGSAGAIPVTGTGANQISVSSGQVILQTGTGTGQLDFTSGVVKANVTQLLGTAWLTPGTAGTPDVNAKLIGATSQTGLDLGANWTAARAAHLDADISSRMATFTLPTNFSALGITAGGHITNVDTLTTYTGNTPQTGDAYARLGAPAGASVSADVAAIKSDTGTILTDVNTGAGAIYSRIGAPAGASIAADIAAVNSKTTNLPASPAAVGSAMTLTAAEESAIADALLNRNVAAGSSTGRLVKEALYVLRNKVDTGAGVVYQTDDATTAFTFAVTTAAGNPITVYDPA